jgi:hypothetical protein
MFILMYGKVSFDSYNLLDLSKYALYSLYPKINAHLAYREVKLW